MSADAEAILEVRDLRIAFGGVVACDLDELTVRRGEVFALIGPNGAGKTSLLNAISGIYRAAPGASVQYFDRTGRSHELTRIRRHRIVRLGVARSLQNLGLFDGLSVFDNVMLGRFTHGRSGALLCGLRWPSMLAEERREREIVLTLLERFELSELQGRPVGTLPYGLKKRVELARLLALDADLILLDEPMAGMTGDEKRYVADQIVSIAHETSATVLLIEHDMPIVMSIAERIMVLNFGCRMALGTPEEVQRDENVRAAYLGAEDGAEAHRADRR
jgi:branched-chain amino acid transport system ATP-binding protein